MPPPPQILLICGPYLYHGIALGGDVILRCKITGEGMPSPYGWQKLHWGRCGSNGPKLHLLLLLVRWSEYWRMPEILLSDSDMKAFSFSSKS